MPTPNWDCVYSHDDKIEEDLRYPLIVKPADTHNSIGVTNDSVVTNRRQLDRQIDAIERNERLIELTKKQHETLASYDKFEKLGNLGQIEAKLAEIRTIQEAQLQTLANMGFKDNYYKRAETELGMMDLDDDPFANIFDDVDEEEVDVDIESTQSIAYRSHEAS